MSVNWDLPCETTEDPPRSVRVLCTDNDGTWPVVVSVGGLTALFNADGTETPQHSYPKLRNVAPKPVRHEAVIALCKNGVVLNVHGDLNEALQNHLGEDVSEVRRIVWHSDGSPVEDKESIAHWKSRVGEEAIRAEKWFEEARDVTRERDHWRAKAEALQAEVDRMRPVVDAAVAWAEEVGVKADNNLCLAIHAYKPIKNWSPKSSEPEKSCGNCGNFTNQNSCAPGNGLICIHSIHAQPGATDKWEPRR